MGEPRDRIPCIRLALVGWLVGAPPRWSYSPTNRLTDRRCFSGSDFLPLVGSKTYSPERRALMKGSWILVALAIGGAAPASAQLLGMPVWNSPSGGSGLTISGDYGKPNNSAGGGNAFGGRATLGFGMLSVTAGVDNY